MRTYEAEIFDFIVIKCGYEAHARQRLVMTETRHGAHEKAFAAAVQHYLTRQCCIAMHDHSGNLANAGFENT